MVEGILGKKIGMTQLFSDAGEIIPVTVIKAGPCRVVQKKIKEKDGYNAIQLGFEEKREERVNKPLRGHFKRHNSPCYYFLKEFKVDDLENYQPGQEITLKEVFKVGDLVDVSGTTKGRGFAGVMKRWNFRGGPGSHGSMFNRAPGSIGASSDPSRVFKGHKLPGHYGVERVTVQNLEVIRIEPEEDILMVKGSVPGARNGLLEIRKARKKIDYGKG